MDNIKQQIADVIDYHTPSGVEGDRLVSCWCGDRFDTFTQHGEHVAERLLDELGMHIEGRR